MTRWRPTCSVVMPAFRSGAFIEEAARSVLGQTLEDLELIVVEDGCPDSSASRVAACGDPRVVISVQEHRGLAAARNVGLGLARGHRVLFLDADDRLRADALHRLSSALDAHPEARVAYGRAARMDAAGRASGRWHRPVATREPSGDVLRVLLQQNFIRCPGAALICSSCFARTHPFDPAAAPGTDWELWCRLANLGPFVALRGAPVIDYRWHPSSATVALAETPALAMRPVALVYDNPALVQRFSCAQLTSLRRKREASTYAWLATESMRAGNLTLAEALFRQSLRRSPLNARTVTLWVCARAGVRPPWF